MSVVRDPMRDSEPPAGGLSLASVVLVPLGLVVICAGLCLGLWVVSVAYNLLYHPDQVPLVSQVLDLIEKDDVVFQAVGSVVKGFLLGGKAILDAGTGKRPEEPPAKR